MAECPLPVVVSIATLPSRIANLQATLDSLLNCETVPDKIFVIITDFSDREQCGYKFPEFLLDKNYTKGIVEIKTSSRDWGPGTKLIGAIEHLSQECILILADDDVAYHREFLTGLVKIQSKDRNSSFSYYTYRVRGLTIGQGCDGFSFYSPNLKKIQDFVETHVVGTTLHYHDDLWISFYLYLRGIRVRRVRTGNRDSIVYSQTIMDESLRHMTGDASRDRIVSEGLPMLIRHGGLSWRQRLYLLSVRYFDYVWQLPDRTLNRARIFVGSERAKV